MYKKWYMVHYITYNYCQKWGKIEQIFGQNEEKNESEENAGKFWNMK